MRSTQETKFKGEQFLYLCDREAHVGVEYVEEEIACGYHVQWCYSWNQFVQEEASMWILDNPPINPVGGPGTRGRDKGKATDTSDQV